jgi:hypothetical protein
MKDPADVFGCRWGFPFLEGVLAARAARCHDVETTDDLGRLKKEVRYADFRPARTHPQTHSAPE